MEDSNKTKCIAVWEYLAMTGGCYSMEEGKYKAYKALGYETRVGSVNCSACDEAALRMAYRSTGSICGNCPIDWQTREIHGFNHCNIYDSPYHNLCQGGHLHITDRVQLYRKMAFLARTTWKQPTK